MTKLECNGSTDKCTAIADNSDQILKGSVSVSVKEKSIGITLIAVCTALAALLFLLVGGMSFGREGESLH